MCNLRGKRNPQKLASTKRPKNQTYWIIHNKEGTTKRQKDQVTLRKAFIESRTATENDLKIWIEWKETEIRAEQEK